MTNAFSYLLGDILIRRGGGAVYTRKRTSDRSCSFTVQVGTKGHGKGTKVRTSKAEGVKWEIVTVPNFLKFSIGYYYQIAK